MINHARTLLLNVASKTYQPGTIGEEYIPPYNPVELPSYLQLPHRVIFGTNPDKVFLNFRAYELLSFIHETELAEFIYALDPRVTYWQQDTTEFFTAQKQLNLNKIGGLISARLFVIGDVVADNTTGRAYYRYSVTVTQSGEQQYIKITEESTPGEIQEELDWLYPQLNMMAVTAPGTSPSGLSAPIRLYDKGLRLRVNKPAVSLPSLLLENFDFVLKEDAYKIELEPGQDLNAPLNLQAQRLALLGDQVLSQWRLDVYARPDSAVTICLPKLEFLGEPFYLQLFGVGNKTEPYATFKNIWFEHPNPAYRLAAFILAMIYRTEELRKRANG
jgi:hypothetical protein